MKAFRGSVARSKQTLSDRLGRRRWRTSKYVYEDLPRGKFMRLLTLKAGAEQEELECTLAVSPLEDCPHYEALSYAWGDPNDTKRIKCLAGFLDITTNLFTALWHLRKEDQSRVLWVDAICIDQKDLEERKHQVLLMSLIYSQAQQVLIWLGVETENDQGAFDFVHWFQTRNYYLMPFAPNDEYLSNVVSEQMDDLLEAASNDGAVVPRLMQFARMFTRPWFERIWIIQEVASATRATVLCGRMQISWKLLAKTVQSLFAHGFVNFIEQAVWQIVEKPLLNVKTIEDFGEILTRGHTSLVTSLCLARSFKSSDRRDKIYALTGILRAEDIPFPPDYALPGREVFRKACIVELVQRKRLDFLSCTSYEGILPAELTPSWVPDWSLPADRIPFVAQDKDFNAAGNSDVQLQISRDGEVLIIRGKVVSCIEAIGQIDCPEGEHQDLSMVKKNRSQVFSTVIDASILRLAWLKECYAMARESSCETTTDFFEQPLPTDFLRCLLCDSKGFGNQGTFLDYANRFKHHHRDWRSYVRSCLEISDGKSESEEAQAQTEKFKAYFSRQEALFSMNLSLRLRNRKFCRTSDGRFGWVPRCANVGDSVCLLYGASTLHVLRPDGEYYHRLIGESYIQGLMHGEVVDMTSLRPQDFYIR